jgi:hypothetical protein
MITFSEIQDAFLFVSSAENGMHSAILCKDSGRIYYRSESVDLDEIEEKVDCNTFIEIPHKNDLDLGRELVFEFVELHLSEEMTYVQRIFYGRGLMEGSRIFWNKRECFRDGMTLRICERKRRSVSEARRMRFRWPNRTDDTKGLKLPTLPTTALQTSSAVSLWKTAA